ncbi:MAG TPA: histidine phosphatase family protein [Thermoleophilaceae bacterium]|nr:histidine phosphatase family protein [Thermoleophilaceae bacterium]
MTEEPARGELLLVRHGETEWSRTGRHTGRTDVPLTDEGRRQAGRLAAALAGRRFERVLTSPLSRAKDTCDLAGLGDVAEERDELLEWDYGEYEGRTTADIRNERPGWTVWQDGCPGGETVAELGERADRLVAELRTVPGDVALFAHGHVLRVLAARWIALGPEAGALLALSTATVSVLGWERETATIRLWNMPPGVPVP